MGLGLVVLVVLMASLLFAPEGGASIAQPRTEPLAMLGVAPGTGGQPQRAAAARAAAPPATPEPRRPVNLMVEPAPPAVTDI